MADSKAKRALQLIMDHEDEARAELGDRYDTWVNKLTDKMEQEHWASVADTENSHPHGARDIREEENWKPSATVERPHGARDMMGEENGAPQPPVSPVQSRPAPPPSPLPPTPAPGPDRMAPAPLLSGQKPWQAPTADDLSQPQHMSAPDQLDYEKARAAAEAQNFDYSAPTASKMRTLTTPAEYTPKASILGSVGREATRHYYEEPPVEAFREEMRPTLGDTVDKFDENSLEYKAYADRKWKTVYANAIAKGEPVTRVDYAEGSRATIGKVGNAVTSAALGFSSGRTAGLGPELVGALGEKLGVLPEGTVENDRLMMGAHPVASVAGNLAGALSPASVASKASALTGAGLKKVAPWLADSALGGAALSVGTGAGGAVLEGGVSDLSRAGADTLLGRPEDAQQELADEGSKTGTRALLGGGIGLLGHGIGSAAKWGSKKIESSDAIRETLSPAEGAGVELGPIGGARIPQRAQELIDQQVAGKAPSAVAMHADELSPDIARQALHSQREELRPFEKASEGYYKSKQGQAAVPIKNTAQAVLDELSNRANPEVAKARAFADPGMLKAKLPELVRVSRVVPASLAADAAKADGGLVLYLDDAERMGIDVRDLARRAGEDVHEVQDNELFDVANSNAGPAKAAQRGVESELDAILDPKMGISHGYAVILAPERLNARQLDEVLQDIDRAAGFKEGGAKPDPVWKQLMQKARADRDQFAPNKFAPRTTKFAVETDNGQRIEVKGWGGLKAHHEAKLSEITARNRSAGLPEEIPGARARSLPPKGRVTKAMLGDTSEDIPKLEPDEWRAFQGTLGKYGTSQSTPDADAALKSFAEKAGIEGELKMLPALKYKKEVNRLGVGAERLLTGGAGSPWFVRALHAGEVRALPLLRSLGQEGSTSSAPASPAVAETTAKLLSLVRSGKMELSPSMRAALAKLRTTQSPYQARAVSAPRLAMRGGMMGARMTAAAPDQERMPQPADQAFTDEDAQNLLKLIQATRGTE